MKNRLVSFDGAELLWIDAILLVPVIFGVMFLPGLFRALVMSVGVALGVTYLLLYWWARLYPTGAGAHVLEMLHITPPKPTRV